MSGAEELSPASVLEDTLGRLAKKSGVKATLLLDRATGAILKMDGQVAALRTASSSGGRSSRSKDGDDATAKTDGGDGRDGSVETQDGGAAPPPDETRGARELAALVWAYVKTSSDLVAAIETEDELKLLRLRTKRQELVIVPDPKYLLIVVHDTPLA